MTIEKIYTVPYELFEKAFKDYQKNYVWKMALIQAVAWALLFVTCLIVISFRPLSYINYIIAGFAGAMAISAVIKPKITRAKLMFGIKGIENDRYRFRLFEDERKVTIKLLLETETENAEQNQEVKLEKEQDGFKKLESVEVAETVLSLSDQAFVMREYDDYFMLFQTRALFYVLPKSAFDEGEKEILSKLATQKAEKAQKIKGGVGA
jgi:hypothetical protein